MPISPEMKWHLYGKTNKHPQHPEKSLSDSTVYLASIHLTTHVLKHLDLCEHKFSLSVWFLFQ